MCKILSKKTDFSFFFFAERTLSKLKINRVNNEIITYISPSFETEMQKIYIIGNCSKLLKINALQYSFYAHTL